MEKQKNFFKFRYITQENLQKEILSFLFGIFSISAGLILGLNVDRCTEEKKEKNQIENILKAIRCEADINNSTLKLYKKYSQSDTANIKSEFNCIISYEICKSEIWINKANSQQMIKLSQYLAMINKVNEFKKEDSDFKKDIMKENKLYYPKYRENFKKAFIIALNNCQISIDSILTSRDFQ